jgi:hypothetical protein
MCSYVASDVSGWYYLVVTPTAEFKQQTGALFRTLMLTTLLAMLLGVALMFWFVSRNYMPLSEIMSTVNAAESGSAGNEFEIIKNAFAALSDENSSIKSVLDAQRERIRDKYCSRSGGAPREKSRTATSRGRCMTHCGQAAMRRRDTLQRRADKYDVLAEKQQAYFDVTSFAIDNVFAELLAHRYNSLQGAGRRITSFYLFAMGEDTADIGDEEGGGFYVSSATS